MSKSEEVQRYIAICHRYKMMGKITRIAVIVVSAVAPYLIKTKTLIKNIGKIIEKRKYFIWYWRRKKVE